MLRQIKDYPNYAISNKNNLVLNMKTGKILKPFKNMGGYLHVVLYNNGKGKNCRIHRLVAEAFIDNPNNLPCVNHIDGNKLNNDATNLERCTYSENTKHAYDNGLAKGTRNCKVKSKPVIGTSLCGTVFKYYSSTMEAERHGFNYSNIASCCRKERKTHKGFTWKFI